MTSIQDSMLEVGRQARQAARSMLKASGATKSRALLAMAEALATERDALQTTNEKDLVAGRERGLEPALLDRLTRTLGKDPGQATPRDIYDALSVAVREELTLRWLATQRRVQHSRLQRDAAPG